MSADVYGERIDESPVSDPDRCDRCDGSDRPVHVDYTARYGYAGLCDECLNTFAYGPGGRFA